MKHEFFLPSPVPVVLVLFAAFSLLLYICRIGYLISVSECQPAATLLSAFTEAAFLPLQVTTPAAGSLLPLHFTSLAE